MGEPPFVTPGLGSSTCAALSAGTRGVGLQPRRSAVSLVTTLHCGLFAALLCAGNDLELPCPPRGGWFGWAGVHFREAYRHHADPVDTVASLCLEFAPFASYLEASEAGFEAGLAAPICVPSALSSPGVHHARNAAFRQQQQQGPTTPLLCLLPLGFRHFP